MLVINNMSICKIIVYSMLLIGMKNLESSDQYLERADRELRRLEKKY